MKLPLQKPIVTIINTMSASNMYLLWYKTQRLQAALGTEGQAARIPGALAFSKELFAKKIVVGTEWESRMGTGLKPPS